MGITTKKSEKQIGLYVEAWFHDRIKKDADDIGMSVSSWVRNILVDYYYDDYMQELKRRRDNILPDPKFKGIKTRSRKGGPPWE